MLDRSKFLRVIGGDPVRWAKRYGIEPLTHPCDICGEPLTTTMPFRFGKLGGLIAEPCKCGDNNPPYALVLEERIL